MIMRILSNKSKTITGAAILLGAASFISRLIGVVRDRILAHQFGAGETLDIYYAAFKIPDLVYNLVIVGALSAGFIPIFSEVLQKNKQDAKDIMNTILTLFGTILIILSIVLWIWTPEITSYLVPGFSEAAKIQVTQLTRIMFLSPILLGISGVVSSVLQSCKSFFVYSLTPIFYNIGIIIGATFLTHSYGIQGLAYGVVIGAVLHLAIQLPTLFHLGFSIKPTIRINKNVRKIAALMIPRTLGLAANQFMLFGIIVIASMLEDGSIAIFNLANNLQYFPIGIIGYSFAIAAFPTLAEYAAQNKIQEVSDHIAITVRQILFFIIPITILFLLLRAQIVRVVLGTGAFDWDDTIITGQTLAFFSLSLFAQCIIPLLARGYYALKDTWTPFIIAVISAVVTVGGSYYLKDILGIPGIALAFSVASILQLCLLWIGLRIKKLDSLQESSIMQTLAKLSIAAIIMAIITQTLKAPIAAHVDMQRFWGIFMQGSIAGGAGLVAYYAICYILKLEELIVFHKSFKKRFLKVQNITGEINEADEV